MPAFLRQRARAIDKRAVLGCLTRHPPPYRGGLQDGSFVGGRGRPSLSFSLSRRVASLLTSYFPLESIQQPTNATAGRVLLCLGGGLERGHCDWIGGCGLPPTSDGLALLDTTAPSLLLPLQISDRVRSIEQGLQHSHHWRERALSIQPNEAPIDRG